jgi:tripartite-type tricarboxylate transporter receptor subunit TctC
VAELGYPGFDVSTWYGIFMPARTPAAVVDVVNHKVNELLATADMKAAIQGQGAEALPMTSQQFQKVVVDDVRKWKGIVEASGATIE